MLGNNFLLTIRADFLPILGLFLTLRCSILSHKFFCAVSGHKGDPTKVAVTIL